MFTRYSTEGIFLKKSPRKEADEFLTVYTRDFGNLKVMGKSIRKIDSKLKPSSTLFSYSELEFIKGRYYNILTDADLITNFSDVRDDLGKLSLAFKASNLINSFSVDKKEERIWLFLKKSFYLLDECSFAEKKKGEKLRRFYYYFSFKFLELLGYKPEVRRCVNHSDRETFGFNPKEGGLVCKSCFQKTKDALKVQISPADQRFLEAIFEQKFEDFLKIKLDYDNLDSVLKYYLAHLPSSYS